MSKTGPPPSDPKADVTQTTLSVLTMNVWNNDYYLEDRMDYVGDLIADMTPDIVCLQEVPYDQVNTLVQHLQNEEYEVYESTVRRQHGELIASKLPIYHFRFLPFRESPDRRGVNIAEIDLPGGESIFVVTTQLESPDNRTYNGNYQDENASLRRDQLKDLFHLFRSNSRVLFAGDTNLSTNAYVKLPRRWHDAWATCGSLPQFRFTIDGVRNPHVGDTNYRERSDRVLYKAPDHDTWHITKFGLVGLKSILPVDARDVVFPSDHFGVFVTFQITTGQKQSTK